MLRKLFGSGSSPQPHPDARVDDTASVKGAAGAMVDAACAAYGRHWLSEPDARALPAVKALLEAPDAVRAEALLELVRRRRGPGYGQGLMTTTSLLGRRRLVMAPPDLGLLLDLLADHLRADPDGASGVVDDVVTVVERSVTGLDGEAATSARAKVDAIVKRIDATKRARVKPTTVAKLRALIDAGEEVPLSALALDDAVGPAMRAAVLASVAEPSARALAGLVLTPTKAGRASAAWLEQARSAAGDGEAGRALVRAMLQAALDAGDSIAVYDYGGEAGLGTIEVAQYASPANESILRNVVWASAALRDERALSLLRALTQKCVVVIGGEYGKPRSLAVALACPAAIGAMAVPGSLAALQGLGRSVRHGSVLREINKAIDSLAASAQVSRSELLETAVENHDLDAESRRRISVGGWNAVLEVLSTGEVVTGWLDPAGGSRTSLPKAVREAETESAKAVAATAKAIRDTVASERVRLDRLFLEDRAWPLAQWRDRYLGHPITGALTRSLVWRFTRGDEAVVGLPVADGQAVSTADGTTVELGNDASVSIWHPVDATEADVRAWRERLLAERRGQALKQVFRETYVVTPAELETRTYSNRFARHIMRQVQARALMKGRGWTPVAVAWWDDGIDQGVARRRLDAHGLRVEFFFDPITDMQPTSGDLWPYCTTDQVRFFELEGDRGVALDAVPRVAFSEVMRDVDLFVAVTTIGADPLWLDRGERRFDTYWNAWSFGDLGEAARVRRSVIEHMLPALRIADRCSLTDRFLVVRGDLRTYKIHLGSSNIQMSPSDLYLCIVAARNPTDGPLYLPFDDDPTLSLILSKAFMLAEDTKITDQTILRQIRAGA